MDERTEDVENLRRFCKKSCLGQRRTLSHAQKLPTDNLHPSDLAFERRDERMFFQLGIEVIVSDIDKFWAVAKFRFTGRLTKPLGR